MAGLSPATGALSLQPDPRPRAGRRRHADHQRGPVDRQRQLRRLQPLRRGLRVRRDLLPPVQLGARRGSTVLYIGGLGRSGSTLVERLAGQLPGACAVGELVHLWERGITEDERCGCGAPFHQCPFWQQAGKTAFGGWDAGRHRPHRRPPRPGGPEPVHPAAGRGGRPRRPRPRPALDEYTVVLRPAVRGGRGGERGASWWSTRASTRRWRTACAGRPASTCGCCTWCGTAGRSPTRGAGGAAARHRPARAT